MPGFAAHQLSQSRFLLVSALFFFSGAAGLLYEVAWFRRLQLAFGVSVFAIGAVVTAFMLGLTAGSHWASRERTLSERPLRLYGLLEGGLAVSAALFPLLITIAEKLYSSLFGVLGGHFLTLSCFRFLLSLLILLPATFCMGATLPTLARAVVQTSQHFSRRVGWLYSLNTLGGVVGTLTAGFFALEHLGIRGTIWAGVAVNAAIALVAFALSRTETEGAPRKPVWEAASEIASEPISQAGNPDRRDALLVIGMIGLVSMALEVIWTRALVFYVHNSTYAFSAILAVYLLGLACGAALAARLAAKSRPRQALWWTLLALSCSSILAIAVYRYLPAVAKPWLGETLAPGLSGFPGQSFWVVRSWVSAMAAVFLQVGAVLFVPAFLSGTAFPLALELARGSKANPSSLVGRFYATNTLGSVAGTVLGSFLLVPLLGTRGALVLLAWVPAILALLVLMRGGRPAFLRGLAWAGVLSGLLAITFLAAPPGFYREMFAQRFGRVLWFSEGVSDTVAICDHGKGNAWIHYSDGRGASGSSSFQGGWLYAHVPLLLHPNPRSALVICFGTGNTLGAASLHPLERLDGVELSGEVVRASKFFKETNHGVADKPGVRIIVEDGRNYLLGSDNRYDVITEEPPLVHTAGVVNLYSKDFYELCSRRLTENGIMAVWLATWELEDREVRMLVRAFADAFPYVSAWDSKHLGEWILIGSKAPVRVDLNNLGRRMGEPELARDLAKIGIPSPAEFFSLYLKGGDFLRDYSRGVAPVTDDRTVVDYTSPRQARANFGLGDFTTGGLRLSGLGKDGLVSELRLRDFDAIYTHRESPEGLITGMSGEKSGSFVKDLKERRAEAETLAGAKIAWNVICTAADYLQLGQRGRSFEVLDWGLRMVGPRASVDLLVMKAELYQQIGREDLARAALSEALAIEPNHARARQLAARLQS